MCFLACALNTRVLAHKSERTQKDTTGVLPSSTVTAKILTFRHIYKTHVSDSPYVLWVGWKDCVIILHDNFFRRLDEVHGILLNTENCLCSYNNHCSFFFLLVRHIILQDFIWKFYRLLSTYANLGRGFGFSYYLKVGVPTNASFWFGTETSSWPVSFSSKPTLMQKHPWYYIKWWSYWCL